MKSEEFATAHHFSLVSSHFYARLSHFSAVYPNNLAVTATICTFVSSKIKHVEYISYRFA